MQVTVLVRETVGEVVVRGRNATGRIVAECVVPLTEMCERHVAQMRALLTRQE